MGISFSSTVIMVEDLEQMRSFYQDILQQKIAFDFGNCIGFQNGISLWKLKEGYPITKKMGRTYDKSGNKNLEICFEADDFEVVVAGLKEHKLNFLHTEAEELWGQQTIRFYDPENNLVEVGETIPCFVKRFRHQGMSFEEVSERTSVPLEIVMKICQ